MLRRTLAAAVMVAAPFAFAAPALATPNSQVDCSPCATLPTWEGIAGNGPWETIWPGGDTPGIWENAFSKGPWEQAFSKGPWEKATSNGAWEKAFPPAE